MKITNTFVTVAPDCKLTAAVTPELKGNGPVHAIQYQLLSSHPYRFTHEDLIFETHLRRNSIPAAEAKAREAEILAALFAKPHACMRASALTKKLGWGAHYDAQGRLAIFGMESSEYRKFTTGNKQATKVVPAMRSKKG